MVDIIAQIFGIIGSIIMIISYQCKNSRTLIAMQGFGGVICESFDMVSLAVYMIRTRFFRKKFEN